MIENFLRRVLDHKDIEHEGSLYMRRFFLARVRGWELVLHKICRADADKAHHDHPGDFATLILRGGYAEQVLLPTGGGLEEALTAGDLRFRSAIHAHRIDRIFGDVAWTLCLRRRTTNEWGFWVSDPIGGRAPRFVTAAEYFRPGYDRAKEIRRGT